MDKDKPNVWNAIKRWRQNRLPSKFQNIKDMKVLPMYSIKFSAKLRGRLFQVCSTYSHMDYVHLHFFKREVGRLGTYKKTIPVGENVFATGRVADFRIKEERSKKNAIEVFTTRGIGYVFWNELKELQPSVDV